MVYSIYAKFVRSWVPTSEASAKNKGYAEKTGDCLFRVSAGGRGLGA